MGSKWVYRELVAGDNTADTSTGPVTKALLFFLLLFITLLWGRRWSKIDKETRLFIMWPISRGRVCGGVKSGNEKCCILITTHQLYTTSSSDLTWGLTLHLQHMHPPCGHVLLWKQAMTTIKCNFLITIMEAHRSGLVSYPASDIPQCSHQELFGAFSSLTLKPCCQHLSPAFLHLTAIVFYLPQSVVGHSKL